MSTPQIDDFRALLAQFRKSDLRDLWASAPDWSVFLAKVGGSAHPQRSAPASEPAASVAQDQVVTAPHLGIVRDLLPPASAVARGARIATIQVLDEFRAVLADRPGTVTARLASDDAFVEFGEPLLTFA